MTQNLRITGTINSEQSDFTRAENFNPCTGDLTSGDSYNEPRCHDSGNTTNGVWYNYAAASAGQITGSDNSTIASQSICPKNWNLPSYDTSASAGSIVSVTGSTIAFSPVTGGYYSSKSLDSASSGYWWSSVPESRGVGRYRLSWDESNLEAGLNDNRSHGYYIRCMRAS